MTFEQLHYFQTIAQLGSFSKAADAIHISQPSLSISIQKLEKELGVFLFQKNKRGAILTEAGRIFLQDTQGIFQQADLAVMHMRQFAQKDLAEIRIAYTASMSDVYIPRLLKNFLTKEKHQYCIYSDELPTDQIAQGLREGRFDLGLGSLIPPDPELELIPIEYQRLCLLLPKSEKNLKKYERKESLNKESLICYRQDYPMYRQISNLFQQWKIEPHIIHYAYSESAIAHLVEQEMGIALAAKTEGLEQYQVQILYPDWLNSGRYIYLLRHRTRMMSNAVLELQNHILENSPLIMEKGEI